MYCVFGVHGKAQEAIPIALCWSIDHARKIVLDAREQGNVLRIWCHDHEWVISLQEAA